MEKYKNVALDEYLVKVIENKVELVGPLHIKVLVRIILDDLIELNLLKLDSNDPTDDDSDRYCGAV